VARPNAEYQAGLPVTSDRLEARIKQFNRRLKGTEKFWNEDQAETTLPLRAAQLSKDDRQGHRTSSCTGGTDLHHERVVPAGRAALDTQAGVLRPFLFHQIPRQPPQQRPVLPRVA
jgi:hypothetical protein